MYLVKITGDINKDVFATEDLEKVFYYCNKFSRIRMKLLDHINKKIREGKTTEDCLSFYDKIRIVNNTNVYFVKVDSL